METMTTKADYLTAIQEVDKELPDHFELLGDVLLVREIPAKEQKTKGGLYIPTSKAVGQVDGIEANRPCWVQVLKVGKGYYDSDGKGDPTYFDLDSAPGDIILVGKLAVKWLSVLGSLTSTPENNLGLVRESEIQARFKGQKVHDEYFAVLESKLTLPN